MECEHDINKLRIGDLINIFYMDKIKIIKSNDRSISHIKNQLLSNNYKVIVTDINADSNAIKVAYSTSNIAKKSKNIYIAKLYRPEFCRIEWKESKDKMTHMIKEEKNKIEKFEVNIKEKIIFIIKDKVNFIKNILFE